MDALVDILISWFPMIVLIAVWIFFMKRMKSPQDKNIAYMEQQTELLSKHVQQSERIAIALEKIADKKVSD